MTTNIPLTIDEIATIRLVKSPLKYAMVALASLNSALSAALVFGWAGLVLMLLDKVIQK